MVRPWMSNYNSTSMVSLVKEDMASNQMTTEISGGLTMGQGDGARARGLPFNF